MNRERRKTEETRKSVTESRRKEDPDSLRLVDEGGG